MCFNLFHFLDKEGMGLTLVYISTKPYPNTIYLNYWQTGWQDGSNRDGHYAWIKNLSAFMADLNAAKGNTLHWRKCLGHLQSEIVFDLNQRYCGGMESCRHVFMMPEPGKWSVANFRNYTHGTGAPFLV